VRGENRFHGNSHGLELTSGLRLAKWWRRTASYSLSRIQLTRDAIGSALSQGHGAEGKSNQHQFSFQSSMDLPANFGVPKYATSDVGLGWHDHRLLNCLSLEKTCMPQHPEFSTAVEIQRSVSGQLTFRW
jgi:hypothetical protein